MVGIEIGVDRRQRVSTAIDDGDGHQAPVFPKAQFHRVGQAGIDQKALVVTGSVGTILLAQAPFDPMGIEEVQSYSVDGGTSDLDGQALISFFQDSIP